MKPSSPSLQFLAAATFSDATTMSSRAPYRGGRNQWRRAFSDRATGDRGDQFVTGESHFQSVRDANRGFRPSERGNFANHRPFRPPPPPSFNQNQQYNPQQQFRPNFHQNQQFGPPLGPPPPHSNQFVPFHPRQQFRPRSQKPLDYRNWEFSRSGPPPPHCERFTILSYNILADYLATNHRSKLYYHIPRHILDWEWRKRSIVFELGLWSPDILCFQEVDRFQDMEEELKHRGYSGIWKMRTGDPSDGCAIFWRISRFKLLHEECIEFNKLGMRDNVAQICVFESVSGNDNNHTSAGTTSSKDPNKVVICNIHVLYNPRRGEIKLGQIRVLLERAHAVSKLWDNAPIVLCGDFNCTPKSPLYNFISEQKLSLSELPRDKVSGQASAEIRAPRQFGPFLGPQAAQNSFRAPIVVGDREVKQKQENLNCTTENESKVGSSLQLGINMHESQNAYNISEQKKETDQDAGEGFKDDIEGGVAIDTLNAGLIKSGHGEKLNADLGSANIYIGSENANCDIGNISAVVDSHSTDDVIAPESDINSCEQFPQSSCTLESSGNLVSTSIGCVVDNSVEITKEGGNLSEDSETFLSELHNNDGDSFPSDLHPLGDEVLNGDSPGMDSAPVGAYYSTYDPSAWTPMEIETATGNADCKFMEHPLKLRSTYVEIEDCSGARDTNGEPLVTSYNRCFLGTVDYIWRSEGLQTVKVLAPMPKHAMQWTPGFPTKKWGSDHIALVSQLAFTEDTITR